jgi:hypothetical protein
MGVEDREDKTGTFYLLMAIFTIEQYPKRRRLLKGHFERILTGTGRLEHSPIPGRGLALRGGEAEKTRNI